MTISFLQTANNIIYVDTLYFKAKIISGLREKSGRNHINWVKISTQDNNSPFYLHLHTYTWNLFKNFLKYIYIYIQLYIIRDVNYLDTLILLEMFMENKNVCNMKTHLSQHCASGIAIIDQCTPRQFLYEVIPHQLKRQKKKQDV